MTTFRATVTNRAGEKATQDVSVSVRPPVVEFPVTEIKNHTFNGEVRVPQGATWSLREGVKFERAHLIVEGAEVKLLAGAKVELAGGIMDEYVGGGATYDPAIHGNDFGFWLKHGGKLTIKGTPPSAFWNRTGLGFQDTDELYLAPTGRSVRSDGKVIVALAPTRYYPGMPIPQIHPRFAAEVANATRDVVISGVGHIHDHSHIPQTWEYARFDGLGISNRASDGPVTGRYVAHRHHGRNIPGSIWRGLVATNSRGRVFVPHGIDGILIEDCISINSWGEVLWWDMDTEADASNDVLVSRLCVMRVGWPSSIIGSTSRVSAVSLAGGLRNEVRESVVSGADGHGWDWPSGGDNAVSNIWKFDTENVAHNLKGAGLRFWTNRKHQHEVIDYHSYRCAGGGKEIGAYANGILTKDCTSYDDYTFAQANGRRNYDGRLQTFLRDRADFLVIGHIRIAPDDDGDANPWEPEDSWSQYTECEYPGGVRLNGDQRDLWKAKFDHCKGVETPDDIHWPSTMIPALEGSLVVINSQQGSYEIRVKDQQVIATEQKV